MLRLRHFISISSALFAWLVSSGNLAHAEGFKISQLPDGYSEGRIDAPYGAYNTPYNGRTKKYADLLDNLEPKVYGLGRYSPDDEINQAKAVYYLEHILLGIHQKLSGETSGLTKFESLSLQFRTQQLYRATRHHAERLYESMIRSVDKALPGPNGAQIRVERGEDLPVLFLPNCRQEKCPTEEERKTFYQTKLADFLAKGGKLNELHLLDQNYLNQLKSLTRLEYAERPDGSLWVTEGKAGHILLAAGGAVRSAGQMILIKTQLLPMQLSVLITSNASGTYKPDLVSTHELVKSLALKFQIPFGNITVTEGEPLGTQTIEVLAKAKGIDKATINSLIEPIKTEAKLLLDNPEFAFDLAPQNNPRANKCLSSLARIPSSLSFSFLKLIKECP